MELLKSPWIKRTAVAFIVAGSLVLLFLWVDNTTSLFSRYGDYQSSDTLKRIEIEVKKPILLYGMVVNDLHVSEDHVRKNQLFSDLLNGHFVLPKVQQQLNLVSHATFDFRKIAAGRKYTLISARDSLHTVKALIYEPNPVDYIIFHFQDSLSVEVCKRVVKRLEKNVTGEIQSSLSETIEKLGISPDLTNKFVDIFGWQVDFQRLQKGLSDRYNRQTRNPCPGSDTRRAPPPARRRLWKYRWMFLRSV